MGAFFLYRDGSNIDLNSVRSCFLQKGFSRSIERVFGSYKLLLYQKTKLKVDNFIEGKDEALYAVGTVVYKSNDYRQSLQRLLADFARGNMEPDQLIGSFFILIRLKNRYHYVMDRAGIQNVFVSENCKVISSSFLAALYAFQGSVHINFLAVTEILCTGSLIGPDTIIKEINRFSNQNPPVLDGLLPADQILRKNPSFCQGKFHHCVQQQIDLLDHYYVSIKELGEKYGVLSGITGGLDSRVLLILIRKYFSDFQFFSTWRKVKDRQSLNAGKVCEKAGLEMASIPFTPALEMDEEKAHKTLEQSMLFMDGQIRANHYWTEEINTRSYREVLLGEKGIYLNGVGGEQYRNEERMVLPRWNVKNWITYELIYRYSGNCFRSKFYQRQLVEYISGKIKKCLGGLSDFKYIDHLGVKRYLNEVYIPANRTLRTNAENQIAFCLSPFTDSNLSFRAYDIIPQLGLSQKFETAMIVKLDPLIASVKTDYGYNLIKGEPLYRRWMTLIKECTPFGLYYRLYRWRKSSSRFYQKYEARFPFVKENSKVLENLDLGLNLDIIKTSSLLSPLMISLGYFLGKFDGKIHY